jgi:nucleotide-binding universal stress UspA family protein
MKIVVGVDGSDASMDALRWARREALAHGATLHVVSAWSYPIQGILPQPVGSTVIEELIQGTKGLVRDMLEKVHVDHPDEVETTTAVARGAPAQVLIAASRDADLLVVGARGLGGFKGLLLGSVSQQCVQHAPCPVVVVHSSTQLER